MRSAFAGAKQAALGGVLVVLLLFVAVVGIGEVISAVVESFARAVGAK